MSRKLNLDALPAGRFLYRVDSRSSASIYEGRIVEQLADPEKEGAWLKLDANSSEWIWSGDVRIEALFPTPEEMQAKAFAAAAQSASKPEPKPEQKAAKETKDSKVVKLPEKPKA
jgi:hypothetical protein